MVRFPFREDDGGDDGGVKGRGKGRHVRVFDVPSSFGPNQFPISKFQKKGTGKVSTHTSVPFFTSPSQLSPFHSLIPHLFFGFVDSPRSFRLSFFPSFPSAYSPRLSFFSPPSNPPPSPHLCLSLFLYNENNREYRVGVFLFYLKYALIDVCR